LERCCQHKDWAKQISKQSSSMSFLSNPRDTGNRWRLLAGGAVALASILAASVARTIAQSPSAPDKAPAHVDFTRDIAPIFQKSCLPCHAGEKPQGGLRLDTEANALKGGESGKAIFPGNSEKSP
jgi:hypothetical protein